MQQSVDLIATCWTIGGDVYPGTEQHISAFDQLKRVEAAAAAGYTGIGLWHGDLLRVKAGPHAYRELAAVLRGNGMNAIELEHLANWFADGEPRRQSDAIKRELFHAADELGARHIKVVPPFGNQGWEPGRLIDQFGQLCAEAAAHDLIVALEMIPFSDLPTLDATLAIVAGADAANGGLLIDIWHMMRAGVDFDAIRCLPNRYIAAAELNDADLTLCADMPEDSMRYRKFCGAGEFDLPGFIRALSEAGYDGPYGVEILSDELRKMPLAEVAIRSFTTTRAQFDRL